MTRSRNPISSYRLHKQSGQAITTINLNGTGKDYFLGRYDTSESRVKYNRLLADQEAGRLAADAPAT